MKVWIAGASVVLGTLAAAVAPTAASRLEWSPEFCEVSRHERCTFTHDGPPAAHRFVTLRGSLRSFSPQDASLHAVYLAEPTDLERLRALAERWGSPAGWPSEPEVARFLEERADLEWIPLEANGGVVVRVDEAHVPGKRLVAVVNARGEILGVHPLWAAAGPIASADR
jgi:hypothetical protein